MKRSYLTTFSVLAALAASLTLCSCDNKRENAPKPKAQTRKKPEVRKRLATSPRIEDSVDTSENFQTSRASEVVPKPITSPRIEEPVEVNGDSQTSSSAKLRSRPSTSSRTQESVDSSGNTALIRSIKYQKNSVAVELIKNGADVNHQNNLGDGPLMFATTSGNVEMVKLLLQNNANINLRTNAGTPALMMAINTRHSDIAALLIEAGADCNIQDERGNSSVYYAVDMNDKNTLILLLKNGADVNFHCCGGLTALNLAESQNKQNLITILESYGAKPYEVKDCTKLLQAARTGNLTQLKEELDKGVHPDSMNSQQEIPIVLAAKYGHLSIVEELISRGCNINQYEKRRLYTALIVATLNGHVDVAKLLVEKGASALLKTVSRKSVLDLARSANNQELVEFFQNAGIE